MKLLKLPADWPAMVTLAGSPPNAAMFRAAPIARLPADRGCRSCPRDAARILSVELGQADEAEDAQPIVDSHHHLVVAAGVATPVNVLAAAGDHRAWMEPDQHRAMGLLHGVVGRIDVQIEAIFRAPLWGAPRLGG